MHSYITYICIYAYVYCPQNMDIGHLLFLQKCVIYHKHYTQIMQFLCVGNENDDKDAITDWESNPGPEASMLTTNWLAKLVLNYINVIVYIKILV